MAGSLGGRSWRVRKLEGLARGRERPPLSPTEPEARAIDAEIREIKEELRALGVDPDEEHYADDLADLSLEEQIAAIEEELEQC